MDLLKLRDKRDLGSLGPGHPKWSQLKTFLKGVKVSVSMFQGRSSRPIVELIPRAGHHTFMFDDREMTVAVCNPAYDFTFPVFLTLPPIS
jgi:hypothetical protein